MLILQGVSYLHPNKDLLFKGITLTVNRQDKIALIGNNGTGKSTLLKILAGELPVAAGLTKADDKPYYVPQLFGQFNDYTVAQALQVHDKLQALKEILNGNVTVENLAVVDDDWDIEERCKEALTHWQLEGISLTQKLGTLSGGQKTKVFLAGIIIHRPQIVLLDEPSNHLDAASRNILYQYISTTTNTMVVVSHDRALLNLLNIVCELTKTGITSYGGNYDFYLAQKMLANEALEADVKNKEKALRKAREIERESMERQQKLDARGKRKQEKAGLPTIAMNTFRNNAEKSTARVKAVHAEKVGTIAQDLKQLRQALPAMDKMQMNIDDAGLHKGKVLIKAENINTGYAGKQLWPQPLNFEIISGGRIAIKGPNGSGKTTLIKLMLGELQPQQGTIELAIIKHIYIDQDYSLINNSLTVYQQAEQFNIGALQEHEIKIRLARFLFTKDYWDKHCTTLSGGEKMRLMLCCLSISDNAPNVIVLDEPTNNLDIQNIEILTAAINDYKGTLLAISHDEYFLKEINVQQVIELA